MEIQIVLCITELSLYAHVNNLGHNCFVNLLSTDQRWGGGGEGNPISYNLFSYHILLFAPLICAQCIPQSDTLLRSTFKSPPSGTITMQSFSSPKTEQRIYDNRLEAINRPRPLCSWRNNGPWIAKLNRFKSIRCYCEHSGGGGGSVLG